MLVSRPWITCVVAVCLVLVGCVDRRESVAREGLQAQVGSQSGGALTLASMTKTNGFGHEREGMKLYTIEWEATIQIGVDGWKAGWNDFSVSPTQPNALASIIEGGASPRRILRGGTAVLKGKSELQKADRGWRVLECEVIAFKVVRPPDVPSDGRSTEINAFFQAFKTAAATRSNQTLAQFILFPNQSAWMPAQTEAAFLKNAFPFSDEQVQAMASAASPRQHDDGTYGLVIDRFALTFGKDRDGYWKWTDFYIGEGE